MNENAKAEKELFVGIKADSLIQEKVQERFGSFAPPDPDGLKIQLGLVDQHWYAGARMTGPERLHVALEFIGRVRDRLVKAVPEARFPESQFRIFAIPKSVPGVVDAPYLDEERGGPEADDLA